MCGIFGVLNVSTTFNNGPTKFITDSFTASSLRGYDSSGIFQLDRKDIAFTHKLPLMGSYFAHDDATQQFAKDADKCYATVGHVRAATQGKVNARNAHPFIAYRDGKQTSVVGCHNGSLTGWSHKPNAAKFDVDSEWALNHIKNEGIDAFKDITGPYCFVWVDTLDEGKLYMARNSGRPMHLLFSEDKKQVYFASESGMLAWITERNDIKTAKEILVLPPDKMFTFDMTGNEVTFTSVDIPVKTAPVPLTHGVRTTAATSTSTTSSLNADGEKFIAKIKAAANYDATKSKQVDAIVAEICDDNVPVLVEQRLDDSPFQDTDRVPKNWFNDATTTGPERVLARKWNFYQELQWFSGVVHDEDSVELLGEVEVWDSEQGKISYPGILRGISQARSHTDFIDNATGNIAAGGWVVVTGARDDKVLGRVLIVSELNSIGEAAMKSQMKKAN